MLNLDEATHPPIAFSAGLPGGIHLSHLPDPRSDRWKGAIDQEMANPKAHDVYELVSRMNGMQTHKLG